MASRPLAGSPTMPAEESSAVGAAPTEQERLNGGAVELEADGELSAKRDAPVGGQAVLEGVMMRGVSNWAVAVRKPSAEQLAEGEHSPEEAALGEIEVTSFPLDSALRRHRLLRLPIVRGIVALGGSLVIGFRALEVSANAQLPPRTASRASRTRIRRLARTIRRASRRRFRRPSGREPSSSRSPLRSCCSS